MWKNLKLILLLISVTMLLPIPSIAQNELSVAEQRGLRQIPGSELLPAYENKTLEGIYNSYEADIRAGIEPEFYTEIHFDNATTDYDHRGRQDFRLRGIYQITKDQICYTYRSDRFWNGTYCFYVFMKDGCYYHYYVPSGFPETEAEFDNWTSMAYAREDAQTCLPDIA